MTVRVLVLMVEKGVAPVEGSTHTFRSDYC